MWAVVLIFYLRRDTIEGIRQIKLKISILVRKIAD